MLDGMTQTPNLIGTAAVARALGKSPRTVHRMVESGELIPAMTAPGGPNGAFMFDPADIERLTKAVA